MFICGREEPIQANEMLYAYNEQPVGPDYELSHFVDSRLNRYSFVWFGADWNIAAFTRLLTAILSQWDADLTWIRTRPYFPPGGGSARVAAFWRRHRLRDLQRLHRPDGSINLMARRSLEHNAIADADIEAKGQRAEEASRAALVLLSEDRWSLFHDERLLVATKLAESVEATFATPSFGNDLWTFLVLGAVPLSETFARPPLRASVEAPIFRPSRQFLAWLAKHPYTIGYMQRDGLGRPGLIIVGTRRIDVKRLRTLP